MTQQPYTLARWYVAPEQEAAFIAAWNDLATCFLSLQAPPHWGTLLRSIEEPRLFYSFGPWPSLETIAAIREHPDAVATIAKLAALCDTTEIGTYWIEASTGQSPIQ